MSEASVLQTFQSQKHDTKNKTDRPIHDNASLLQSMDLIMIKSSNAVAPNSTSVVFKVFNMIDRREVATLQVRGGNFHPSKASLLQEMPLLIPTIVCFAWSPNGQSMAVVTNQAAAVRVAL
jgi:hypothetical protein